MTRRSQPFRSTGRQKDRATNAISEAIERQPGASDDAKAPGERRDFITFSLDRLEARLEALTKRLQQRAAGPAEAPVQPRPAAAKTEQPENTKAKQAWRKRGRADAAVGRSDPPTLDDIVRRELAKAASSAAADTILDELSAHGFSQNELHDLVVPRRTLSRRSRAGGYLSMEESDRAVRLARITALAERVFGDAGTARRWLRKASPMLSGSVPLSLLKSETGAHLVEQALHRIDYGMFA